MSAAPGSTDDRRLRVLEEFAAAYNRHDVEAIMALMADDCEFVAYRGPDPCGERFAGYADVRARVGAGLAAIPGAQWTEASHHVVGDKGFSEWTYVEPRPDGTEVRRQGIDVFTFDGHKIASKSTFQKWVVPGPQEAR